MKKLFSGYRLPVVLFILLLLIFSGIGVHKQFVFTPFSEQVIDGTVTDAVSEDGSYDSMEEVAAYLHEYSRLPSNYITKEEAGALGWQGGSVEVYAPGKCIGGNRFSIIIGKLPLKIGRKYYECDIDTLGNTARGPKRIVYSDDGLIFYTADHYETFLKLCFP